MQRISKCCNIQHTSLAVDEDLNILMYKTPFCSIIYTRYKLLKMGNFLAHSVYSYVVTLIESAGNHRW